MSVDVNAYLARSYGSAEQRPCWQLVADVYRRELDEPVTEYKSVGPGIRAIAAAFRLALTKSPHGFMQVSESQQWAVMLLSKRPSLGWHHCGVLIDGRVLHAVEPGIGGVVYQDLATVLDAYRGFEYWARAARALEAPAP